MPLYIGPVSLVQLTRGLAGPRTVCYALVHICVEVRTPLLGSKKDGWRVGLTKLSNYYEKCYSQKKT